MSDAQAALVVALKDEVDASARRLAGMTVNLLANRLGVHPGDAIPTTADVKGLHIDGYHEAVANFFQACIAHSQLRARYAAALMALPKESSR